MNSGFAYAFEADYDTRQNLAQDASTLPSANRPDRPDRPTMGPPAGMPVEIPTHSALRGRAFPGPYYPAMVRESERHVMSDVGPSVAYPFYPGLFLPSAPHNARLDHPANHGGALRAPATQAPPSVLGFSIPPSLPPPLPFPLAMPAPMPERQDPPPFLPFSPVFSQELPYIPDLGLPVASNAISPGNCLTPEMLSSCISSPASYVTDVETFTPASTNSMFSSLPPTPNSSLFSTPLTQPGSPAPGPSGYDVLPSAQEQPSKGKRGPRRPITQIHDRPEPDPVASPGKKRTRVCDYCLVELKGRRQEYDRHVKSHFRDQRAEKDEGGEWECCGVPAEQVQDALEARWPHAEVIEESFKGRLSATERKYNGMQMWGGCGKKYTRKHTLAKHLEHGRTPPSEGGCFRLGSADAAYLYGNIAKVKKADKGASPHESVQ